MPDAALAPSEQITVNAHGRDIEVNVYKPEHGEPAAGILMLHELFGIVDGYREDAVELASRGYLVWLPNLFTGGAVKYCVRAIVMASGRNNEPGSGVNREVHDLLDALKNDAACNGKLGMIGMCLTGGYVLHMAKRPDMEAPVIFHHSFGMQGCGVPAGDHLDEVRRLHGHWAEKDVFCPAARRKALKQELGDRLEYHEYPIQHGFRSFQRDKPESQRAWDLTVEFFGKHLG